jgi:shikimate dehydrogenase
VKLALIGDPVEHSRSPIVQRQLFEEAGLDGSYVAIRIARGHSADAVRRMREDGFLGCNVTYPLKEEVVAVCDVLEHEAQRAAAVNTIFFGRRALATNTDGMGARSAVETLLDEPIALRRVGVLGTGATARAILAELHDTDAYSFVWGRDQEKVANCCERYEAERWPGENPPEIVISTLPPEIAIPPDLREQLRRAEIVMDVNYGERATLARDLRREVVSGDAMLEAQARASLDFWLARLDGE